jgi:transposase
MRDDDGRKLDHKTLEQLRIRAVDQIQQGAHPDDVAAGLGMTRAAVYGWLAKYTAKAGWTRCGPSRSPDGRQACPAHSWPDCTGWWWATTPRQLRFAFALWTRAMVRELIRREFGVRLSEVSVGRLLRKLGLSPQRPLYRAYQQNPEAVARWKAETYPQLRREAASVGATIYFADEAGVRSDYHAGTTWAPVGHTPVVATTGDRFAVNLISAVTAKGKLRFAAYDGHLNGPGVHRLLPPAAPRHPRPVFLVLDGHPVHCSKAVKQFAASTGGRLRLCFLPVYAPELNPDRMGMETRKARPHRPGGDQRPGGSQSQGAGGAASATTASAPGPGLLPGS